MSNIPYGFAENKAGIFVDKTKAEITKEIYRQYLDGKSLGGINDFLFEQKILSPTGQEHWTRSTLNKTLYNPKYTGYIISPDDYLAVQIEKSRWSNLNEDSNKRKNTRYNSQNVLSGLLVCSECGANYRRITRPSGEVVWRCANKVEHGKDICKSASAVSENYIKQMLCKYLNMSGFDEKTVKASIETIFVKSDCSLEIEYKYENSQNMLQSVFTNYGWLI